MANNILILPRWCKCEMRDRCFNSRGNYPMILCRLKHKYHETLNMWAARVEAKNAEKKNSE